MSEQWFSYSEFKFSREQIVWALEHLQMLRQGQWPPEHRETGYVGGKGKKRNTRATFENPASVASEIDWRLCQCNSDGLFLEMVYSQPDDKVFVMQHIAVAMGVSINEVETNIHKALHYCCGSRRRNRTYTQWKNHQKGISTNTIMAAAVFLDAADIPQDNRGLWDGKKFIYQKGG